MAARRGKQRKALYKTVAKAAALDRVGRKQALDKKKAKRDQHYSEWQND